MPVCMTCQHEFELTDLATEDMPCPACGGEIAKEGESRRDVGPLVHPLRLLATIYQDAQAHISEPALSIRLSKPLSEARQRLAEFEGDGPARPAWEALCLMAMALEAVQKRPEAGLVAARRRDLKRAKAEWVRAYGIIRAIDPRQKRLPTIPLEGPGPGNIVGYFVPPWLRMLVVGFLLLVAIMSIGLQAAGFFTETALAFAVGLVGLSAVWVWMDAKVKNLSNAEGWLALTILSWPVAFPVYVATHALNRLPFWSLAAGAVAMIAGLASVVPLWLATSVPALALGLLALMPSSSVPAEDRRTAVYGIAASLVALFIAPYLFPVLFSIPTGPGAQTMMAVGAGLRFFGIFMPVTAIFVVKVWKEINGT